MSSLADKALEYLGRGWAVIPAQPKGKKPLVEWSKYIDQRPSAEQVREWWSKWPNANIAVITGRVSGIVVVDVDTGRGGDPTKVYNANETKLISRTGSGGFHLFYAYPDDVERVPNRVGKDGLDVRADGGYVIVPPSQHESKNHYKWLYEGQPAACPGWVKESADEFTGHEANPRWLSELLAGVLEGGRNDACARLAGYFAEKGMAREVATLLVKQWNDRNDPPLPDKEVETTIGSVYKAAARKLAKQPKKNTSSSGPRTFNVVSFDDYMVKYGNEAVRWNIVDWLPVNTVAFVISPPGSYKTWAVMDLAVSIASGKPFLGTFPVLDPGPVLIIQQEDYHGQIADRAAIVTAQRFGLLDDIEPQDADEFFQPSVPSLPIYFHPDRLLKFNDDEVLGQLEAQIDRIRPKLVVIDPLYSAASTEDYMAKTAEQMFVLKRMRDQYNCSFLVVHHTKKSTEGASVREGAWGSQFLNAFLETGWQIRRTDEPHSVSIRRHFKVKGDPSDLRLTFDIKTDVPPYKYEVKYEEAEMGESGEGPDLVALIEENGPLSAAELAEKAKVHRSTVSRRVAPLIKSQALVKRKDGKFALSELPSI